MRDFAVRQNRRLRILPILILALACRSGIASATAQPQETVAFMVPTDSPYHLYQTIGQIFWDAEHQLQERVAPFSANLSPYKTPLEKSDPLYQKYFQVEQMADEYIQFLDDPEKSPLSKGDLGGFSGNGWTLPTTLYLGGIAAFTIGDYASAQKYFSRLLENHADYKRYSYIGDNYTPDPDFAQPAKPGITKLLFYCQIVNRGSGVSPEKVSSFTGETPEPRDQFIAFQQFNKTTQSVLSSQQDFARWLLNRPYKYQRRIFLNEDYGDTPDQRRATALPKTAKLIEKGWQNLFAAALKKSGSLKMRQYLRQLFSDNTSLQDIISPRLAEVDQLVIKHYFAQAKVLLGKKNFAATRKKYRQIIAEYPDSDAARRAEAALPGVTPIAVNYYEKIATKHFHPAGNIGVPQDKASLYYEKMYNEDKTGPKADAALYYWARALGTEGKVKKEVKLLQQHLATFPQSEMRAQAMYLLGFLYCSHQVRDEKRGVPLLLQVTKEFPKSPQAPEALWNAAYILGWNKQYAKAIPLLQQLKKQYPKSPRSKWADEWIAKYQEGE